MSQATREIVITRIFNAPRARVWHAWTDPEQFKCWWGPKGFVTPYCSIDLRVGGKYLNCIRSSEGEDYWSTGTYQEVVDQERLVSTDSFADKDGNIVPASTYGKSIEWPADALIALTFEDHTGKTRLTLKYSHLPEGKDGDMTVVGLKESFDRLENACNK